MNPFRNDMFRFLILVYILGFLVLTAGYKGGLMSFLTVPNLAQPMNTAQDIVDSNLPVKSLANTVEKFLELTDDAAYKTIYKR